MFSSFDVTFSNKQRDEKFFLYLLDSRDASPNNGLAHQWVVIFFFTYKNSLPSKIEEIVMETGLRLMLGCLQCFPDCRFTKGFFYELCIPPINFTKCIAQQRIYLFGANQPA